MVSADDRWLLLRPASIRTLQALIEGPKSLTELAAAMRLSKPTLLPILRRLTEADWIERTDLRGPTGREISYSLRAASLHLELRPTQRVAISWATAGGIDDRFPLAAQIADPSVREQVLTALRLLSRSMRKEFDKGLFAIILFGSAARGEMTWKSDIDLMFLFDHDDPGLVAELVHDEIANIQEFVTHPVRGHTMERSDFLAGEKTLAKEAAKDGLVLTARKEDPIWTRMARYRSISI